MRLMRWGVLAYIGLLALLTAHLNVYEVSVTQTLATANQDYLGPLAATIRHLGDTNQTMNVRLERARTLVLTLKEENLALKRSLRQGVEMLQEAINENAFLNDEINRLKNEGGRDAS